MTLPVTGALRIPRDELRRSKGMKGRSARGGQKTGSEPKRSVDLPQIVVKPHRWPTKWIIFGIDPLG